MASKAKFFSWTKGRQSTSEPYHRTGGLLPIDTSVGDVGKESVPANDAKSTSRPGRRRPPNLTIIPPDYNNNHLTCLSSASAHHSAALVHSASNLLAAFNDILRSPAPSATACSRSSVSIHKPLPSRPRSASLPSTPDLPVELPGSLLLENQGFPPSPPVAGSAALSTMRSVRSGNSLSSSATNKPSPSKVPQHKKSLSEASLQRRSKSRPSLITSPSSTESKLTTCSTSTNGDHASSADSTKARVGPEKPLQPSPLIVEGKPWKRSSGECSSNRRDEPGGLVTPILSATRGKQVDELKATITAQDQTISTLQAQFASLRVSHEAHVASLNDAHSAEVASLRNYTKALEDQQAQRTLHHASSNNLLFLLDTTEPQSPNRESPQTTAGSGSANSIRSFKSAFEQQTRSPLRPRDSPEMENLKRKLSTARRPETGNGDMVRELNMYKQNNTALQKQVESLMAKLNQSKEEERKQKRLLEDVNKVCVEWQEKASKVEQLEKSILALQNTIDHLEHRLEVANCEKVDAEEQLFNLQTQRTPFDPKPPSLQVPIPSGDNRMSTRTSMSTVFANESPISQNESQEPTTLAAFISHIERLQEQIRVKDARITELQADNEHLQRQYNRLQGEHRELNLQSDIQGQLLTKTKQNDIHIEELRSAIIQREAIIGEKIKALQQVERQLDHHRLLLEAEVRRHATLTLLADVENDPLPDLTSLASKEDIDRWIERLQKRLKKETSTRIGKTSTHDREVTVEDLRKEIDFYVREIIYYKLDCRGYKSDIKKLKKIAAQMGNHGSRPSDIESPDPSVCRSGDTPIRARFFSGTTSLAFSATPSPISTGPMPTIPSVDRPSTPPAGVITPDPSPADAAKQIAKRVPRRLDLKTPMTPRTPPHKAGVNLANEADNIDPGISPRSVARLSPERRKPTPPSPDQEKFGDMATNFPLSTPAAPKRIHTQRSMSDSILQLYTQPRTPEVSPAAKQNNMTEGNESKSVGTRGRSGSLPGRGKGQSMPERPPRPRFGLFESPVRTDRDTTSDLRTPPRMDVMAEAIRNSPEGAKPAKQPQARKLSNSSATSIPFLSKTKEHVRSSSSTTSSAIPAPLTLRSREGSAGSSTMVVHAPPTSQTRRPSTASSSNVPFVIAMGSPHNPALVSPTAQVPPSACSITGKVKVASPTLRTGVGGTMASTTPIASPVSPTDTTKPIEFSNTAPTSKATSKPTSATSSRNQSITSKTEGQPTFTSSFAAPTAASASRSKNATPSHSRNVSGSSIRQAINLPARMDFIKGKGKARKDSISNPTPLASPFDIDRSRPDGSGYGIGEAI